MSQRFHRLRPFVSTLAIIATAVMPFSAYVPAVNAASSLPGFPESFGTGPSSNDVPGWDEAGLDSGATTLAQAPSGSGNDSASPDGDRFAKIGRTPNGNNSSLDEWICKEINASGYSNLQLSYYWRNDGDSHNASDDGVVEYHAGSGDCSAVNDWHNLQNHDLRRDNNNGDTHWTYESPFSLASLGGTTFRLRFRNSANATDEYFRVDGVALTGDQAPGTLIVKKTIINNNGGTATASTFSFQINGGTATAFEGDGQNDISVAPGTYSVVEVTAPGYTATYSDCSNVSIASGQTKTCTITNDDIAPTLKVKKHVVSGPLTADQFTMLVTGASVSSGEFPGSESGTTIRVKAGDQYAVNEAFTPDYDVTASGSCSGTLALGQAATCTLINTHHPHGPTTGTLVVKKVAPEGVDVTRFSFSVNEGDPISFDEDGQNDLTEAPGSYTIVETASSAYDTTYDGCTNAQVTVGQTTTCTITNTPHQDQEEGPTTGMLVVVKHVVGSEVPFDHFSVSIDGAASSSFDEDGQVVLTEVESGPHTIAETASDSYTASFSENCSGGTATVVAGETTTCTVTNTFPSEQEPTPTPPTGGGASRHPETENQSGGGSSEPTPTPEVTPEPTPTPTPEVLGASTAVGDPGALAANHLSDGDLIRAAAAQDPDVYKINLFGYKRLFLNPPIFGFSKFGWKKIKPVSAEVRDVFPTSALLRNCQAGDPKVYAMESTGEDTGLLHWVDMTPEAALAQDPEFFNKIFCVDNQEFSWYEQSPLSYTSLDQVPVYHRQGQ